MVMDPEYEAIVLFISTTIQVYHAPRGPTHDGWDSARGAFWPISRVILILEVKVRAVW